MGQHRQTFIFRTINRIIVFIALCGRFCAMLADVKLINHSAIKSPSTNNLKKNQNTALHIITVRLRCSYGD